MSNTLTEFYECGCLIEYGCTCDTFYEWDPEELDEEE